VRVLSRLWTGGAQSVTGKRRRKPPTGLQARFPQPAHRDPAVEVIEHAVAERAGGELCVACQAETKEPEHLAVFILAGRHAGEWSAIPTVTATSPIEHIPFPST
jgi:hypothetical protein